MALIKFIDDENVYDVTLINCKNKNNINRIKIIFNPENKADELCLKNGFIELNEHNHVEQTNYRGMKYIYRKFDDNIAVVLTENEDDIYTEPIPEVNIETTPHIPTLNEVKQNKIAEFSAYCSSFITTGISLDIDGETEYFTYNDEDQINIKELFDTTIQTKVPMYYHANGKSCKLYSVEQIVALYSTASMNKMHHQTYFNQMKMYILSLKDKESVEALVYEVSELTGEYLDVYNAAMEQAKNSISVLLNNAGLSEV